MSAHTISIIALVVKSAAGIGLAVCAWKTYRAKRRGRRS